MNGNKWNNPTNPPSISKRYSVEHRYQTFNESKPIEQNKSDNCECSALVVEHGGIGALLLNHSNLVLQALQTLEEHAEIGAHVELNIGRWLVVEALFCSFQLVARQLGHEQHWHPHREELESEEKQGDDDVEKVKQAGHYLLWLGLASCTAGGLRSSSGSAR